MHRRVVPLLFGAFGLCAAALSGSQQSADKELIQTGMVAWKTKDVRGRACVSCHSPEGLELAFYGFDDKTIVRRATAHVSQDQAQSIVAMVHALRRKYRIYKPLDPMEDRPMQPGGRVLPGATPAERDLAFAKELDKYVPLLTSGTVDSLTKAREAQQQVLSVNVKALPIGIQFNRISEDVFHGPEHATIANWIPDTPVELSPAAELAKDRYLAEPSDANLQSLESALEFSRLGKSLAQRSSLDKYRSLLLLQHTWRQENPTRTNGPKLPEERLASFSPMWDLAEMSRTSADTQIAYFGLPDDIRAKKETGPKLSEQLKQIRLPWYWMGWLRDPGLQHISIERPGRRGDYFIFSLLHDGPYPMHAAFMILRKQFTESFDPRAWNSTAPQHFVMNYSTFLASSNFNTYMPSSPELAKRYQKFVTNAFRTSLYLLLDETRRTKLSDYKIPEISGSHVMADYIASVDPHSKPTLDRMVAQIELALASAKEYGGGGFLPSQPSQAVPER